MGLEMIPSLDSGLLKYVGRNVFLYDRTLKFQIEKVSSLKKVK